MGLPPKLLKRGIRDMVRISDGRMSGTAYGTVVLHAVPEAALRALEDAARVLAQGTAVLVVPLYRELTTQEAADLLNVSRPHLVKLVERGEIPHHMAGSHRRIYAEDLMRYREVRDVRRRKALQDLTRESARLGLDY